MLTFDGRLERSDSLVTSESSDISIEDLGEGYKIAISKEHRFGTDAFLLADFASPRHKDICCDLCAGNGIVGLLMLRNFQPAKVTAVELQKKAYELAMLSKELSGADRFEPQNCDLRQWRGERSGAYDVITCNPPYKIAGTGAKSANDAEALARHEIECTIFDVCEAAKRNLKYGGRLCICNRPERLAGCISAMRQNGIEPKRLRTVHKNAGSPAWLILLEGRFGGSGFMKIEPPLIVQGEGGEEYSDEMKRIYRL